MQRYYQSHNIEEEWDARGYKEPERGEKFVCTQHFSNPYITQYVWQYSHHGSCTYCGRADKVIDLADLVAYIGTRLTDYLDRIDNQSLYQTSAFQEKGERNIDLPGFKGDSGYIIGDDEKIYEKFEEIAADFNCVPNDKNLLVDISDCFIVNTWIRKDPFTIEPYKNQIYEWNDFKTAIIKHFKHRNINPAIQYNVSTLLDEIIGRFGEYHQNDINEILADCVEKSKKLIKTLERNTILYRGRPDYNGQKYTLFTDITSAPIVAAKPNRLSQSAVSVFYGSFDEVTPVVEISNYSSGKKATISLGEFKTKVALKVIDFTHIQCPDFWMGFEDWQDYRFLNEFHNAITCPVCSRNNLYEYLSTQIFTEVLRNSLPNIDGIIYKSFRKDGTNICLFYDNTTSANVLQLVNIAYHII